MNKYFLISWPSTEKGELKIYLTILVAIKGYKLFKWLWIIPRPKMLIPQESMGLLVWNISANKKGQRHYYVMLVLIGFKIWVLG